ncbi:hypothetical protein BJ322DRAFT_1189868 [Thelephora terrestris]|uniref:Uncharacterized protein n=1 Tax=Thelephora terrestris TaxID=56493 RepID=A0A9P6L6V3_9AGAM|nr:hypothetical protein BJ322DRAFT_1189868 [Thelephora terrestris]
MSSVALARIYQQSFESRPYYTLAVTNGTLNALGDVVAQSVQLLTNSQRNEYHHSTYDPARTVRFFIFGLGMGPLIGRWNVFLERRFPPRVGRPTDNSRISISGLTKRVSSDQLLMAPTGLAMFLASMGIMEGCDAQHIRGKFKDLYGQAIIANWQVWPLVQFVNFRFMPLPYRVPFQSTCGVFWTLYLSLLNSAENVQQDRRDSMENVSVSA